MTRVLAISGSLRTGSHNTAVLAALVAAGDDDGIEYELLDPATLKGVEPYDADDDVDPAPPVAAELRRRVADADGLLIATPEYNATLPGQLKHLIDWTSRPRGESAALYNKPVAVISASPSPRGAVWAGEATRRSFEIASARVIAEVDLAIGGVADKLDGSAQVIDAELSAALGTVREALARELAASGDPAGV